MTSRESRKADLALAVLRRQFEDRFSQPDRGPALQLALRVLMPYVGRHDLITFWNVAGGENPLQRINNLKKIYPGIEARVRRHVMYARG
jgi:hypothetical protein